MYRIVNTTTGQDVGKTDKPHFIVKHSNGCYVHTDEENAQGVAYRGTPYNLLDREGVGAEETVMLIECDAGDDQTQIEATLNDHSKVLDDLMVMSLMGGDI